MRPHSRTIKKKRKRKQEEVEKEQQIATMSRKGNKVLLQLNGDPIVQCLVNSMASQHLHKKEGTKQALTAISTIPRIPPIQTATTGFVTITILYRLRKSEVEISGNIYGLTYDTSISSNANKDCGTMNLEIIGAFGCVSACERKGREAGISNYFDNKFNRILRARHRSFPLIHPSVQTLQKGFRKKIPERRLSDKGMRPPRSHSNSEKLEKKEEKSAKRSENRNGESSSAVENHLTLDPGKISVIYTRPSDLSLNEFKTSLKKEEREKKGENSREHRTNIFFICNTPLIRTINPGHSNQVHGIYRIEPFHCQQQPDIHPMDKQILEPTRLTACAVAKKRNCETQFISSTTKPNPFTEHPTIRYTVNSLLLPFILLYAQGRHEPEASIVYQLWQSSLHPIKWTMEYYEQSPKVLQWKYCGDDTA
ncbi:hypothetical protein APICC_02791 [Apis cerana cerana]|uniref:Uncharacterized protein n=1 Tax=Apis cerana cerana TaxID=94128 RepID=A0A2A3EHA5_APICC|nr:hypothetical protein APICC_02791 [Apis cerana cerana]